MREKISPKLKMGTVPVLCANKKGSPKAAFPQADRRRLLGGLGRALAGITLLELVDASGGIHDLLLARVERMGFGRDLDLVDRILLAVFPLDGFVGRDRGAGHEAEVAARVEENNFAVIGVNAVFHCHRLVGGHKLQRALKNDIIRENANESKGLLPNVVVAQALEQTGFFTPSSWS